MTDRRLRIEYDGIVYYDKPVGGTFSWTETATGVSLSVSEPKPSFLDTLKAASEQKRAALPAATQDGE